MGTSSEDMKVEDLKKVMSKALGFRPERTADRLGKLGYIGLGLAIEMDKEESLGLEFNFDFSGLPERVDDEFLTRLVCEFYTRHGFRAEPFDRDPLCVFIFKKRREMYSYQVQMTNKSPKRIWVTVCNIELHILD